MAGFFDDKVKTGRSLHTLRHTMLAIDVESTGFSRENDRICSVGFAWSNGARARYLVNPLIAIPREATAIHGITNDDVAFCPSFEQIAPVLANHLTVARLSRVEVVTYNGKSFDIPMLVQAFSRTAIPLHALDLFASVDLLPWARRLRLKSHKLRDVSSHLGVRTGISHEADADAEATIRIAAKLIDTGVMPDNYELAQAGPRKEAA